MAAWVNFLGRPRFRRVDSRLYRLAVDSTQPASPNGCPRAMHRLSCSSSFSLTTRFTRSSQLGRRGTGHLASLIPHRPPNQLYGPSNLHSSACRTNPAANALRSTYHITTKKCSSSLIGNLNQPLSAKMLPRV